MHMVMQSKGGAGKSVVAAILAQFLKSLNDEVKLVDTDPNNKTLASYQGLEVQALDVIDEDTKLVNQGVFDQITNPFLEGNYDVLVDTGSGEFLPLYNYMRELGLDNLFKQMNKHLVVHVPITYDGNKEDTLKSLEAITKSFPDASIVIWENSHHGKKDSDILNSPFGKQHQNIIASVHLQKLNPDTEGKALRTMLDNFVTIDMLIESGRITLLDQLRLKNIRNDWFTQLEAVFDMLNMINNVEGQSTNNQGM